MVHTDEVRKKETVLSFMKDSQRCESNSRNNKQDTETQIGSAMHDLKNRWKGNFIIERSTDGLTKTGSITL